MQLQNERNAHGLHDALDHGFSQLLRLRGVLDSAGVASGLTMSISEALGLRRLAEGATTQQELGSYLGLEKSTVSRLVDALIAKGLAEKQPDPQNARFRNVTLTAEGQRESSRVGDSMRERHVRMLAAMTTVERNAVAVALPALVRALAETES
ncbi:MAG: MarR family transcriptional regulator [Terrimesophilobacter sp.]